MRFGIYGLAVGLALALMPSASLAAEVPPWLPRYHLDIHLDPGQALVKVRQKITWTNRHRRPTRRLVINAHANYGIPDQDLGLLAKTVEILRMSPSETLSFAGPALQVQQATLLDPEAQADRTIAKVKATDLKELAPSPDRLRPNLDFSFQEDNQTALVVPLPFEVGAGQAVTVELAFTLKLPPKKGRWGQWGGVTTLAQWLPVLACYDEGGWQPTPFIPWHQPFFNEAGLYTARITLPASQKLACSGHFDQAQDLGNGWQQIDVPPVPLRDFALIASSQFEECTATADGVEVRCLYLPEHAWYGQELVKCACAAIPVYNQWFGRYPYSRFTIVEAYFGWNGNECGSLVMIDQRMMNMPHLARNYVDYLVSHELCHQWWYNVVGTNGYCETWMDEGLATYFSHRLMDKKLSRNNTLLEYPKGLQWLPNIHRDDFRHYGLLGTRARGEDSPTVQEMPKFGHLINLTSMTYDRGSKIVGMIEERLGEAAFFDFMRHIYKKYQFRILRVADYQRELEEYTGRSWQDFFQTWLYSKAMCDWVVERVEQHRQDDDDLTSAGPKLLSCLLHPAQGRRSPVVATVYLRQQGQANEPTVLGIRLKGEEGYHIRIPIDPELSVCEFEEWQARVESFPPAGPHGPTKVRVTITLPCPPAQISVDPDNVLLDCEPVNNHWKTLCRFRFTPIFTRLDEADVTCAHDRWNFLCGPWFYMNAYNDPWYTRSPTIGFKAGFFRTQLVNAGAFVGYRTNDRNLIAGGDAVLDHWPWPRTQMGVHVEQSLATLSAEDVPVSRGVAYGRYVFMYGSSLYLPPFEYLEAFGTAQNRCLPLPRYTVPGADLFKDRYGLGLHYHKNLLTPYWDPEGGLALDATYMGGLPIASDGFQQVYGQISLVKYTPDWLGILEANPLGRYVKNTRWALRLGGGAAVPLRGQFFTLGGADMFRGFDLSERQGSLVWVGSIEWRLPLAEDLHWDFCDHIMGVRNIYLAPFYDIGDAAVNSQSLGPVAHAVGLGLRVDVAWLGLIERTMLRLDVAQTVNANTPTQFWIGVQHPF